MSPPSVRCREEQARRQEELAERGVRSDGREAELRRREEELKREEAALVAASLELQAPIFLISCRSHVLPNCVVMIWIRKVDLDPRNPEHPERMRSRVDVSLRAILLSMAPRKADSLPCIRWPAKRFGKLGGGDMPTCSWSEGSPSISRHASDVANPSSVSQIEKQRLAAVEERAAKEMASAQEQMQAVAEERQRCARRLC